MNAVSTEKPKRETNAERDMRRHESRYVFTYFGAAYILLSNGLNLVVDIIRGVATDQIAESMSMAGGFVAAVTMFTIFSLFTYSKKFAFGQIGKFSLYTLAAIGFVTFITNLTATFVVAKGW